MKQPVSDFRLKMDMHIVNSQERVTRIAQILSFVISLATIISIIIYHGFYIDEQWKETIQTIIHISLFFYIFKYFLLLFYSLKRLHYLKDTLIEFIVILILILYFISISVLPFGFEFFKTPRFNEYYILIIQIYFLVMVTIELSKASNFLTKINLSPPKLMLISFLFLIMVGTALLMLPQMTVHGISFIDALFTSTSASCVTGLTVLDTGSDFTFKGQVIIMILVQMGGLSILTFATFFTAFFSRKNTGLRYQYLVKDLLSTNKVSYSFILLKEIVTATLIIEGIGVMLLYMYWKNTGTFASNGETFLYSIFHTISAFNNAGFSLWGNNLMHASITDNYFPLTVIMILVFMGGIGFMTLSDFFNPHFIKERKKYKWKRLMPGTKIVLLTTFSIILTGSILFFLVEYNHSLANKESVFGKIFASMFQVIASRTAGFNTIDINQLAVPGMLLIMMVMFIGASPGSTGGGIKTTTFFVIIKSTLATIKGKKNIEFEKKTIPFEIVDKSYSIVIMSMLLIFISTFILALLEPSFRFLTIVFESISAFTTSGLSTGNIVHFGWAGKLVLVINMYIGRIGTLTLAFALSKRVKESKHEYPSTYFMVG